jgi:hypothetical protein
MYVPCAICMGTRRCRNGRDRPRCAGCPPRQHLNPVSDSARYTTRLEALAGERRHHRAGGVSVNLREFLCGLEHVTIDVEVVLMTDHHA